jgi:hypothetical protein
MRPCKHHVSSRNDAGAPFRPVDIAPLPRMRRVYVLARRNLVSAFEFFGPFAAHDEVERFACNGRS